VSPLEALVENLVAEGRQLEYKEQLPGDRDAEKTEFLRDVTSFANAAGGDLLFGIRERRDAEGKPTGEAGEILGLPGLNFDAVKNRLENLLRDGVDPRLSSVEFHQIPRPTASPCLLLRVSRSWTGPHMITFNRDYGFYSRNSAQRIRLDTAGVREAILAVDTAITRTRAFRSERISRLLNRQAPVPLGDGGVVAFHAVPLAGNQETWQRLLRMEEPVRGYSLAPEGARSLSWRFNLDGWLVYNPATERRHVSYVQTFRDGGIEVVHCFEADPEGRGGFYGINIERNNIQVLRRCKGVWGQIGVEPPVVMSLTLSGVVGKMIFASPDPRGLPP
jgi:hypothetical protein